MRRLRQLRAWLAEPIQPYRRRDTTDWQRLGSSFGRMVGGAHDYGRRDTPSADRWDKGADIPVPPGAKPIRRWVFLLIATLYIAMMVAGVIAVVWFLTSLPPPTGTHH